MTEVASAKGVVPDVLRDHVEIHRTLSLVDRLKTRLRRPHDRAPRVRVFAGPDGAKYKLIEASGEERHWLRIRAAQPFFECLDFVPRVVWSDRRYLLVEFIDGDFPDMTSRPFAVAFGTQLAQIHGLDVGAFPAARFLEEARDALAWLVRTTILDASLSRALDRLLDRLYPSPDEMLRASLVYADWKPNNFVVDRRGRLMFIDLGAFATDRPTDEYLFGNLLYQSLDQKPFVAAYRAAGGFDGLLRNEFRLAVANQLRMAAYRRRLIEELPFVEWRHKYYLRRNLRRLRDALRRSTM